MNFSDTYGRPRRDIFPGATLQEIGNAGHLGGALPLPERLAKLRRSWLGLSAWTAVCVGLALAYCLLSAPKFLVTTDVVLEPRLAISSADMATQSTAPTLDSALADSQVQILTSERNLKYVFDAQHLEADPEFAGSGFDPIGWLVGKLSFFPAAPLSPAEKVQRDREVAFERFEGQVSAKRLAQSYAFELAFYADNPAKAARLANAITAAYIRDKVLYNVAAAAAQRGSDFLQNRVADNKAEIDAIENAVRTGVIPNYVFGHADARIISTAVEPLKKTFPKTTMILALALAFGLMSGVGFAIVGDEFDRRPRTARRLRALTGVSALAALPYDKVGKRGLGALLQGPRAGKNTLYNAEMRKLRVKALELAESGASVSIGVVSWRRGEGRSAISASLARLLAETGRPTALVDGDTFNPKLTTTLSPQAQQGLSSPEGNYQPAQLAPDLTFLAAPFARTQSDPEGIAWFKTASDACARLSQSQIVVIDLPPVSESPEGVMAARGLAGVFAILDAQVGAIDEFFELLDRLAENDVRILGVALNRAEVP